MILPPASVNIDSYDTADLLTLRDRINARLPPAEVERLDLSSELVRTFQKASGLLDQALDDDETNLSQKSAMVNSLNALLKSLVAMQTELFSVERAQKLERHLIETLAKYPELQSSFLEEYSSCF